MPDRPAPTIITSNRSIVMPPPIYLFVAKQTYRRQFVNLDGCRAAGERERLERGTRQPIERQNMGNHQDRHVEDRDRVDGAQLSRERGQVDLGGMVIVDEDVGCTHDIEGNDKRPEQRTYPYRY